MSKSDLRIRAATPDDAAALLAIYAPYVQDTAVSFEYEVPGEAEFRDRIAHTLDKYPYLVAERDGMALGYAYTGPFARRAAYGWSAETSVYVRRDARRLGVGRRLYGALEAVSREQGVLNLNACIAYSEIEDEYLSCDSVRFHARLGYGMVGRFHRCGYKFGRWYDMVWMEKLLGAHPEAPFPVRPFPSLDAAALRRAGID